MSDQSDIGAKLDRVVNELHETNKLLIEVIADNKHRDSRLGDVESVTDKHDEDILKIKDWHTKNDETIEDLKLFIGDHKQTIIKQKDRDDRNKKAYDHIYVKIIAFIALSFVMGLGLNKMPEILKPPTGNEQNKN